MNSRGLTLTSKERSYLLHIGVTLGIIGFGFLVEQVTRTGWLALFNLLAASIYFCIRSILEKQFANVVFSAVLFGCCAGLFWLFNQVFSLVILDRIGLVFLSIGVGFMLMLTNTIITHRKIPWWAFFVGWTLVSISIPFLIHRVELLFFVLFCLSGVGSGLLFWGLGRRLIGLIIPGSILSTTGIGVYAAWINTVSPNGLTETGIMLVWFALGWGAIIVFSRVITTRFVWWPLIPGGILAVVGWGLYSGGNPNNALSFIGNTGSIGVLIFGLYLLLIRRGLKG